MNSSKESHDQLVLFPEVRPDWLDGTSDYRLPDWYDGHRVHAHTRLSLRWLDKDAFTNAAKHFKQIGVHTFVRHIKSGNEGAWWPSKVGAIHPDAKDRNIAKEIIDEAHNEGMRIIIYHRHMEDEHMAEVHPDWVCRDEEGKPLSSRRGDYMCFNSPYADYFLARASELVDLGVDGFYFDEVHMPKAGCWCDFCREGFTAETGLSHPAKQDFGDPIWHRLRDFTNLTIERTFVRYRKALHERNPELVILIASNLWPNTADRHTTNRLYRIADGHKTEFSLAARTPGGLPFPIDPDAPGERDAKIALGYTLARDATDGRPAHVWCFNLLNETSSLYATAGMVTHGCIANLDIQETTIPNPMFQKAFELGERVSPYFAGTTPLRWAAMHFSEYARDQDILDPDQAWVRVLNPFHGAFHALLRARLPVGVITDSQLEEGRLDSYRVLFLPAPDRLNEPMSAAVSAFRAGGGLVIEQKPEWHWHEATGLRLASDALMEDLEDAALQSPVRVVGGPEKMHAVSFINAENRLTISLANDFSWVFTGRDPTEEDLNLRPPPPCEGVRIRMHDFGQPARVFEAVQEAILPAVEIQDGFEVSVPTFEHMAVVGVDLG